MGSLPIHSRLGSIEKECVVVRVVMGIEYTWAAAGRQLFDARRLLPAYAFGK